VTEVGGIRISLFFGIFIKYDMSLPVLCGETLQYCIVFRSRYFQYRYIYDNGKRRITILRRAVFAVSRRKLRKCRASNYRV